MNETYHKRAQAKLVGTIATIFIIVGLVFAINYFKKNTTSSPTTPTAITVPAPAATSPTQSKYKDGTFSANSDYTVPSGYENIALTVTLKNGIVTDSTISNSESNPTSASFQEGFAAEYKSYVVGKKISDIHLSYIAGASDTTQGFNDALAALAAKAQG